MIILYYTNGSSITKTFHGVTFGPGETKEVFGIINDPKFTISSKRQEPPKCEGREISPSEESSSVSKRGRKSKKIEESSEILDTADSIEETSNNVDQIKEV